MQKTFVENRQKFQDADKATEIETKTAKNPEVTLLNELIILIFWKMRVKMPIKSQNGNQYCRQTPK